jgi:DNA primase
MIPPDFIQTLLGRVDIVDVIDQQVHLKKSGANFVACCPFHNEKTPSFSVSQTKQFYHCFGCGAHGTALGFLMEYNGLPFVDAVRQLAEGVGLQVPQVENKEADVRRKDGADLSTILSEALKYYRAQLKDSPKAIEYLKRRGLSGQIAARFGIGFAPDGWQNLATIFPEYSAKSLVTAGLVIEGDSGKRYDRFRDRVMFPIWNQRNEVIGFGGRVLDKGEPKYLNSPETPVFEKGRELYGLTQAMKAIRASGKVIVVEGYMDVVALAQHGVEYAVATLGTATSATHIQRLSRLSDHIIFCFDGDGAGRRAAWRALEISLPHLVDGKEVGFLFLPQEHDPDSYIRDFGREKFEEALTNAIPLSAYLVEELQRGQDLHKEEGRAALLQTAKPLLKQIAAPLLSVMLRKRFAEIAGIARDELDGLLDIKPFTTARRPMEKPARRGTLPSAATQLAAVILAAPELAPQFNLDIGLNDTPDLTFLRALVDFCRRHPDIRSAGAIEAGLAESADPQLLSAAANRLAWMEQLNFTAQQIELEFQDGLAKMKKELEKKFTEARYRTAKSTADLKITVAPNAKNP